MNSATVQSSRPAPLRPVHAFFLAATVPPFLGAVLSDYAYKSSYEVQWANFASWLLAGGLAFGAVALVCALVDIPRGDRRRGVHVTEVVLLLAMWILGFIDALVHARDAWAAMPTGFVLSLVVLVLAAAATWVGFGGFSGYGRRATP